MVSRLVVASFTEDLSWLNEVVGWDVIVYQKNAIDLKLKFNQVLLPNIGRETHTFLHHLFLGDDADRVAFVQGNPFDHDKFFLKHINSDLIDSNISPVYRCLGNGEPDTSILDVDNLHLNLFGEVQKQYKFAQGAMNVVSQTSVRKRNRIFWKRCLELLLENPNVRGHEFERSWGYIFDLKYATD